MNIGDSSPASRYVTLVEVVERTAPFEEFSAAARAVAQRVEAEGVKALVTLQFYADPGSTEAGAVISFTDPDQVMEHIHRITKWEEFTRFAAMVRPVDMRVYGTLGAEAEAWLRSVMIVDRILPDHVAGFVRGDGER